MCYLFLFASMFELSFFNPLQGKAATSSNLLTWESTSSDVEDTFVSNQNPVSNYSTSQYLVVGKHQTFGTTRSYLKFKLPELPKGAVVHSAKLSLYQYYNSTNQA
ncbi:DNRLRE domain-containing protein [Neobacillus niacini]|uniref:DNRLRE domain-containing protein n=1 Tax=Neobacillus niacini TaxID=86668 RepID=UPI0005EFE418|nr:DNRLRE domain-containing protein [Neobacillus niacini]